ncbi:hypothetical protein LP52_23005 [Streptomonospora alba]|uniref:Uncharacterized protein n=1 Tax=Streptomonospora alba TaxID=183763 RepID=A0A0C2JIQ2_9ACTN|nr:hypothetical protein [Streptomonospora alba]KIH96802.1 hypothetical protein LP52_23005 [Streptomonospora alba]
MRESRGTAHSRRHQPFFWLLVGAVFLILGLRRLAEPGWDTWDVSLAFVTAAFALIAGGGEVVKSIKQGRAAGPSDSGRTDGSESPPAPLSGAGTSPRFSVSPSLGLRRLHIPGEGRGRIATGPGGIGFPPLIEAVSRSSSELASRGGRTEAASLG